MFKRSPPQAIAGATIPIALHENGPIPDPDQLQSTGTKWLYFDIWTAPFPETSTSVAEIQKVYSSAYVITRDEMPSLKSPLTDCSNEVQHQPRRNEAARAARCVTCIRMLCVTQRGGSPASR